MIKGRTYKDQIYSSPSFRVLNKKLVNDGILAGCEITVSGNNVVVATGFFVINGGIIEITENEIISAGASGTKKLCYQIDLTQVNTTTLFNQGSWIWITGNPTQTDELYQLPFISVVTNGTTISSSTVLIQTLNLYGRETLYSNATGTAGIINMPKNLENFDYLEIYYKSSAGSPWEETRCFKKVSLENISTTNITAVLELITRKNEANNYLTYISTSSVAISNTIVECLSPLTIKGESATSTPSFADWRYESGLYILITKIVGIKE